MANDRLIDRDLGRYHVESLVDIGGMGAVYRARDTKLDRTVALKVLSESRARDESFRQRFLRESRMLASIDHPNIVPVFEADEAEGELFIAMRFINGPDLGTLVHERGPLDSALAVSIINQMGDALDYAHAQGLVHRDIKPANIMVVESPRTGSMHAYLTDFGLTKVVGGSQGLTEAGGFVGTSAYVAPEQIQGKSVDHRADVYSLGCVLYDLLTGTVPFPRDSTHASLWAHVNEPPPKPTRSRDNLPPALDGVIETALAKNPDDRFQSAGALALAASQALASDAAAAPTIPLATASGDLRPRVPAKPTEIRAITGVVTPVIGDGADAPDGADAASARRGAASTELRPLMAATPPMPGNVATEVARAEPAATFVGRGAATEIAGSGPKTELVGLDRPIEAASRGAAGDGRRRRRAGAMPIALAGLGGLLLVGSALATGGFGLAGSPRPSAGRDAAAASLKPVVASPTLEPTPGGTDDAVFPSSDPSGSVPPSEKPSEPPPPSERPSAKPNPSSPPVVKPPPPPADTTGPTGGKVTILGSLNNTVTTKTTVSVRVTTKPTDKSGIDLIACSNTKSRPAGQKYATTISCPIAGGHAGSRTVYVWFRDKSPKHNWSASTFDRINYDRAPVAPFIQTDVSGNSAYCDGVWGVIIGPAGRASDPDGLSTIHVLHAWGGSPNYESRTATYTLNSDRTAAALYVASKPIPRTRYTFYYTVIDAYNLTASGRWDFWIGPC